MLDKTIRVLNFDDSVTKQAGLLSRYQSQIIDLRQLGPYARYFYSPRVREEVAEKIPAAPKNSLTFLGSGDFHHISEILISRFDGPLSVIMFDFHPDWDIFPPRYGCGSWVTEALKKKANIAKFILLGVSSGDISTFSLNSGYLGSLRANRVEIYPYEHKPSKTFCKRVPENVSIEVKRGLLSNTIYWKELQSMNAEDFFYGLLKRLPVKDVYLSVDKDCLDNNASLTNWEEGKFTLEKLLSLLKLIKDNLNIVGMDITGDYSPILVKGVAKAIFSRLDHPEKNKSFCLPESSVTRINQETNLKLLELML